MSVGKLATALSVIFVVSVVALAVELLYVLWRHRSFLRHASPAPHTRNETVNISIIGSTTKELLYFLCLKPQHELDPPGPPVKAGSSPDDQVVDVYKLLEAKGPARFLCTIKEEGKEEVESTPDVDFSNKPTTKIVCLQSRLHLAGEPEMFSTPCDSPVFFTPVGSPSRDFLEPEFVVSVNETGNNDDR
ncbi:hypothetical protein Hanom_Chr14g01277461 [Helianthus anomalus]